MSRDVILLYIPATEIILRIDQINTFLDKNISINTLYYYCSEIFYEFSKNDAKQPTYSFWGLTLEVIFLPGKITLPWGISTGLGKITSLATLGMLFSPNQSRFPKVKWFSLVKNYLQSQSSKWVSRLFCVIFGKFIGNFTSLII